MVLELATEDKLEYSFLPNSTGVVQFRVRAPNDAHIALCPGAAECNPMYEVFIGGWGNNKSVIRKNRQKPEAAEVSTPHILDAGEFRGFWIRWNSDYGSTNITVGREGEHAPFLQWTDSEIVPIEYVGICTGWGATGSWIIEEPGSAPMSRGARAAQCWVASSGGRVPPRALAGGEDNGQPIFVVRANFNGGLIPGKLIESHGCAYIPWGGTENAVSEYEVLCDCNGTWVPNSGGNIPPSAVTAGQTEEGEPLYIGRVLHGGSLTVGKVQPSHSVCYIPYGGQEMGFPDYEILVA